MILRLSGATDEELARGVAAAQAVLAAAGVTLEQGERALWEREGWDIAHDFADDKLPPESVMAAASALDKAHWAAMEACCAGWAEKPAGWQLEHADDCSGQDRGG
ncbi:hypothetical protein [Variovorax fucosicus]|uniref:hypothetical protein n=1 Tax=Variovorax fucosicus TaxID=3053517 RepID=UPI0025786CB3|nr:hypothetical protein [Variovorax sp. J22G47]MDM0058903.1 hypothetical protein [Variovorax sp. J22G47]